MKLEKSMYVRIKNQADWCCIGKIVNTNEFREPSMRYCVDIQGDDFIFVPEDMIVKASYSLVGNDKEDGVIEAGDYVNGVRVERIDKDPFIKGQINLWTNEIMSNYWGDISLTPIRDKDIKSIVTKEQFESMSYKVGE